MRSARHTGWMMLLLMLTACASTQQGGRERRERGDTITRAEIEASAASYTNAYDLVRRLEPQWLVRRGRGEEGDIVVYVNDVRVGGPEALRGVSTESILEIRHLDAAEAVRYGSGHQHGVILVQTR